MTARRLLAGPALCLALLAFLTSLLVSTGSLDSIDTARRLQVAHALWAGGGQIRPEDAADRSFVVIGRDHAAFATWGIGQSLLMLPADFVAQQLVDLLHPGLDSEKVRGAFVACTVFPLLSAASALLAFRLLALLGFAERHCIRGVLALLVGTTFLSGAQVHAENSLLFLLLLAAYVGSLAWLRTGARWPAIAAGCALGFGLLVRLPSVLDAAAVWLFTIALVGGRAARRDAAVYTLLLAAGWLPFVALDRLYHWHRFGTFYGTYTSLWGAQMRELDPTLPAAFPFSTPLATGLAGFLWSPDRSMFLFNPLLLVVGVLAPTGWRRLTPPVRALLVSLGLLLLADMGAYATWFLWGGAGAWGPRYVLVPSQALCLLALPLAAPAGRGARAVVGAVLALSVAVQVASVLYDRNLELAQQIAAGHPLLIVWQRLVNIAALATGHFDPPAELHAFATIAFLPWRNAAMLPPAVADLLRLLWWAGLLAALLLAGRLLAWPARWQDAIWSSRRKSRYSRQ